MNIGGDNKKRFTFIFSIGIALIAVFFLMTWFTQVFPAINAAIMPVIIGIFIAFLLNPVLNFFESLFAKAFSGKLMDVRKKRNIVKLLSILVTTLIALAMIISVFLLIIPEFFDSLTVLINDSKNYFDFLQKWVKELPDDNIIAQNFDDIFGEAINTIQKWLTTDLPTTISTAFNVAKDGVILVFNFIIGFIISIYVMKEKEVFAATSKKICYALFNRERANDIILTARHGNQIFGQFLSGKVIESSLVGVLFFIFMSIFGIKYSLLISVIMGVCNFIPMFGPYIGGIPSGLILLMADPGKVIGFVIMVILIQTADANVFGPLIMGQKTGLSEFWITFAIFFFGGLFGLAGLIIGIPLLAVIFYVVRAMINNKLTSKELPTDNKTYYESDILTEDGFTKRTQKPVAKRHIKNPFKRKKQNEKDDDDDDYIDINIDEL